MAQARVTEFFSNRKRNGDIHPSKRRKLAVSDSTQEQVQSVQEMPKNSPSVSTRTRSRANKQTAPTIESLKPSTEDTQPTEVVNKEPKAAPKKAAAKPKQKKATTRRGRSKVVTDVSQTSIVAAFKKDKTVLVPELEVPTAACDDHCASPPSSPSKRSKKGDDDEAPTSRKRGKQNTRKDLIDGFSTPEKGFDFSKFSDTLEQSGKTSARKKLLLKKPASPKRDEASAEKPAEETVEPTKIPSPVIEKPQEKSAPQPQKSESKEGKAKEPSQKEVGKVDISPESMKLKLSKCGKLEELKQKLAEHAAAKSKLNKKSSKKEPAVKTQPEPTKTDDSTAKAVKVPAYEKYHHLATPAPPSLLLPFKYKLLEEIFQGMETVISMLHNRSEICTYDKLKPAVEGITRKQFELKHIGQVQTVYSHAYILRQEKGLPCFGKKTSGYVLTLEPDLEGLLVSDNVENQIKTKNAVSARDICNKSGKIKFSAAHCLERRKIFHGRLVEMVKEHHKTFLSTLDLPLTIPDDKLTRWHPKFRVDELPAIEAAPIPTAPDSKKYTTAKDLLETPKSGLNPRVKAALEKVAKKEEEESSRRKSVGTLSKEEKIASNNSTKPVGGTPKAASGMQSLLEKIRAKEAQKQVAAMTRSPEDEAKLQRMERLPDLVRILRTFFVSQKRPAISMDDAIQTMTDSYRSALGKSESEKHLKLILELVPEWISCIKISKGSFLKINKDKDINAVMEKLQKQLKAAR